MRRANGAAIKTTGKAISHAVIQTPIHVAMNPSVIPATRSVDMPDTRHDMSPESTNPNNIGSLFFGNIKPPNNNFSCDSSFTA